MAESSRVQPPFLASETSQVRSEHSHSLNGPLDTTQTDSGPLPADKPNDGATIVKHPTSPKPVEVGDSTLPMTQPPGSIPGIATPPAGALEPSREASTPTTTKTPDAAETKKEEAHTGEKHALESSSASPITSSGTDNPPVEKPEEPEVKKSKVQTADSDQSVTGIPAPAASTSGGNHGQPKKASRPKKEKIKDALKKAIPSDGIGSRTRSRTNRT
ncbi:hypothetical protein N7474_009563 [Penicillium riverlandense]|uniref:uncharacterized protein n=1 Tax=Penicillium riverlandense TaxID=1903569 RepID=UPI00254984C7|nr:uncharacterized protein N7474_009563 [Penicillium riverlandense]KAJ5808294.1 hypothetical protein N7474_009563 [Penicillium riverlandense]